MCHLQTLKSLIFFYNNQVLQRVVESNLSENILEYSKLCNAVDFFLYINYCKEYKTVSIISKKIIANNKVENFNFPYIELYLLT